MNNEYTFLGGLIPREDQNKFFKKSLNHFQTAADKLQWNFIDGIEKSTNVCMSIISAPFIGSFPKNYKEMIIHSYCFHHREGIDDQLIGFLNLSIIKQFYYHYAIKRYLKKYYLKKSHDKKQILIVYSTEFIPEIEKIKKICPNILICLIIPDLPNYTSLDDENNIILKLINKYKRERLNIVIKEKVIDYYVLLTKLMAQELNIPNTKYTVIEGIANRPDLDAIISEIKKKKTQKNIVYTGTLAYKYGILNLISAFKEIKDKNCRLIICGGGLNLDSIKKASLSDIRIIYKGLVDAKSAQEIQFHADVLVNPRSNDEIFTKYSFPSKLLEYISTGHPVVCYKLDGIPDDYDDVLLYADKSKYGLEKQIQKALLMTVDEKIIYAKKAISFIINNKTAEKQCNKIILHFEDKK